MILDSKFNHWVRQDSNNDLYTLDECQSSYRPLVKLIEQYGWTRVMDIGGHIGGFTRLVNNGQRTIQVYEPENDNFKVLLKNYSDDPNVHLVHKGIADYDGHLTFYLNTGQSTTTHSSIPIVSHKRKEIQIPCVDFLTEVEKFQPDVIKFDAEGAEYLVMDQFIQLPKSVKGIAIEITIRDKNTRKSWLPQQLSVIIKNQFPNVVYERPVPDRPGGKCRLPFIVATR